MGIPALEDGLFVNLLVLDYLCIYMYILDSHMAPHGAVGVEQSEARSSKVIPNMISNVIANVICNVTCSANVTM